MMILLYSQNPSMTTAAASHTYRTVTLTRYTLNYATLPDDPQLCGEPRSEKKYISKTIITHTRYYNNIISLLFFFPSGAIRVGSCCTCTHTVYYKQHGIVLLQYVYITMVEYRCDDKRSRLRTKTKKRTIILL